MQLLAIAFEVIKTTDPVACRFGLSDRYVEEQQAELVAMTPEEFQQTARDYFVEDEFIYVIVGDAATQLVEVRRFAADAGLGEVVELDKSGERLD